MAGYKFVPTIPQAQPFSLLTTDGEPIAVIPVDQATLGGGGGVTAVTGVAPIGSTGGATPAISITPATPAAAGSMSAADKTKLNAIPTPTTISTILTFDGTNENWRGAPGTSAYNPTWYAATNIFLDPVSGNDTNSGTVIGSPVKTMAQVIQRYGSTKPVIPEGQNLTITQLSAMPNNGTDAFYFDPQMSGGSLFVWDGLTHATLVGGSFHPTSVTAKSQAAAGNQFILNGGLPGGALQGQLVHNTTKNSYAFINNITGGNATVDQPLASLAAGTAVLTPTEDNTWVNTDSYQLLQPLHCNWVNPQPSNPGNSASVGFWVQGVDIADTASDFAVSPGMWACRPMGCWATWWLCSFEAAALSFNGADCQQLSVAANPPGLNLWGCSAGPNAQIAQFYNVHLSGGDYGGLNSMTACTLDSDTFVFGGVVFDGINVLQGGMETAGNPISVRGKLLLNTGAVLWSNGIGSGAVGPMNGGQIIKATSTWAAVLKTTTLHIDSTATAYTPIATGTFVNNGTTQVDTTGVSGTNAFPANAPISFSLNTVGGSIVNLPFFSAAQTASHFHTKATAGDTSTYNWEAGPGTDTLTPTNLTTYISMNNPYSGSAFVTQQ